MTKNQREFLFFDIALPGTVLALIGLVVALLLML
jgi:hypothetical protein